MLAQFLAVPARVDSGAAAGRKLDFQGDRIQEGFEGSVTCGNGTLQSPNHQVLLTAQRSEEPICRRRFGDGTTEH